MSQTKKAEKKDVNLKYNLDPQNIIQKVMGFLRLFMSETLVKRIVSMILISAGVENERVTELTGLCDRSVRGLRKSLGEGINDGLFKIFSGGDRCSKLLDVEEAVIEEINSNNYHSKQQIADMIEEKHGIKVSVTTVARLLKKTESSGLNVGLCRQKQTQ